MYGKSKIFFCIFRMIWGWRFHIYKKVKKSKIQEKKFPDREIFMKNYFFGSRRKLPTGARNFKLKTFPPERVLVIDLIFPLFHAKIVSLAAHVFGRKTSEAILHHDKSLHIEQFDDSLPTVIFNTATDVAFDICTSRENARGWKSPLCPGNYDKTLAMINSIEKLYENLHFGDENGEWNQLIKSDIHTGFNGESLSYPSFTSHMGNSKENTM